MNLDITQQTVLNLVSGTLFSYPIKLPDSTDWNRLYMEAIQQAVFPIVYPAVCNQLPTDEQGRWSIGFYNALASNMRVNYEHTELDSMMKNAGIPYVILKGVASDSYYPEPNLRTMGDVDFFVYEADFNRVCLLMESEGFERIEETDAHFAYRRSSGSVWEVHWQMSGIPRGDAGNMVHKASNTFIYLNSHGRWKIWMMD